EVRHGGDQAFFTPTLDYIQMPHQRTFRTMDHYASVWAHEVCNIASVLISRTVDGLCALLFPNHRTACCAISGRES
ncbi:zincin-like metallopeptidase domain-containing protein, partial [Acinetobacter baumannii]